jgi:hypothetical protein
MNKNALKTIIKSIIKETINEMARGNILAFSRVGGDGKNLLQRYAEDPESPFFRKTIVVFPMKDGKIVTPEGFHIPKQEANERKNMKLSSAIELALSQSENLKKRFDAYKGENTDSKPESSDVNIDDDSVDTNGSFNTDKSSPDHFTRMEMEEIKHVAGKSLYQPFGYDKTADAFKSVRVEISNLDDDGFILITKHNNIFHLKYVDVNYPVDEDKMVDILGVVAKIKDIRSHARRELAESKLRNYIKNLLISELK